MKIAFVLGYGERLARKGEVTTQKACKSEVKIQIGVENEPCQVKQTFIKLHSITLASTTISALIFLIIHSKHAT